MRQSEQHTLNAILKHKDHFDQRLLQIATSADNKINALQNKIFKLKSEKENISDNLRNTKMQLKSKDSQLNKILVTLSKKEKELTDIKDILKEIERIKNEQKIIIDEMQEKIDNYEKDIEDFKKIIKKLKSTNSTNSNMGSSFDVLSRTKAKANANTRIKSNRKRGGQSGHVLHRSRLLKNPDMVIEKHVDKVPNGAFPVVYDNNVQYYATQEIDLVLRTKVTETRYYLKENGEKLNDSLSKKYAINPITYSPHFKASIVYLNQKGTIPMQRLSDIISEISYGEIELKPSTIALWSKEVHERSKKEREQILNCILKSKVTHVDETGIKINGNMYWVHTITNEQGSYFLLTKKRGDKDNGPIAYLSEYEYYLVHDHFKTYFQLTKCKHVECNAHIDRYMKAGIDIDKSKECEEMLELLHKMLSRKIELIKENKESMPEEEICEYEKQYEEIAKRGLNKYYAQNKKCKTIYEPDYVKTFRRMIEFKEEHLRFIKDFVVPYTNNAAERQCRVIKTKKKVSGQFVSEENARSYVDTLTILQTAKLRNENALATLERVFS